MQFSKPLILIEVCMAAFLINFARGAAVIDSPDFVPNDLKKRETPVAAWNSPLPTSTPTNGEAPTATQTAGAVSLKYVASSITGPVLLAIAASIAL